MCTELNASPAYPLTSQSPNLLRPPELSTTEAGEENEKTADFDDKGGVGVFAWQGADRKSVEDLIGENEPANIVPVGRLTVNLWVFVVSRNVVG